MLAPETSGPRTWSGTVRVLSTSPFSPGKTAVRHLSFADLLKRFRPILVITSLGGISVALLGLLAGFDGVYDGALTVATLVVILALAAQIVISLRQREFGLDTIALLSMSSALFFGENLAAAVVALMYSGGQYLESIAEGRARREMTALLTRAPRIVTRRRGKILDEIAIELVEPGDQLVVRRGDIIPADGILIQDAVLNEAALTGEAFPVDRKRGQPIMSGSANAGDLFEMTATKSARESTYAGIVKLVEAAHASKARMSRLADRYAFAFLCVTLSIAGLAWLLTDDPVRAVAVLVVATPCPLILAVPVAWTAGMSRAAGVGLIVKGADILEKLGQIQTLVLDKTGTLTDGKPHLVAINAVKDENELLRLIASLDQGSNHVAARAVVSAALERDLVLTPPTNVSEKPGEGISGYVGSTEVAIGGLEYIASKVADTPSPDRAEIMSAAVALDGRFAGTLHFSDALREGARETLTELKRLGLNRLILATGDRAEVARAITSGLPLSEIRAGLTPAQKIELVRKEAHLAQTMMVGDGVNDAPALAAADVGIAMGLHGSAAAAEAADAVLLSERLERISDGIKIARDCRRIAMQSVIAGIGLSVGAMIFASLGFLKPVEGALLQEAIDVAVVLNALRALRMKAGWRHRRQP
ncbi:Heavy metal translocating P-type ATPase [Agrobacterium salinitolerans str. Hayward 0363]|uniref:P-type Zn(2+) transporter n=1 Tax=Agrobacterium tumefaciens TaxID=358 RepID=A0AAF0GU16_AGRTU|nr:MULTISPECIES: heavy metal translocating P-type ATPase [Agrobacterium]WGM58723.1 heavy metal translocating P-type ATPase [Agrobacterium tumefaciens]CVI57659.1 Heavy metal translocating P-type ATPase [Agrobacterium salinitolerans str. Hayward 0363]